MGTLSFLAACIGTGNLIQGLRRANTERLLLAQEEIEHLAKLAERERIARDMHDVLGHTLSVVVLKSELAGKLLGADAERARQILSRAKAAPAPTSPPSSISPKGPCAIIYPKPSASSARRTASTPRGWRGRRDGYSAITR